MRSRNTVVVKHFLLVIGNDMYPVFAFGIYALYISTATCRHQIILNSQNNFYSCLVFLKMKSIFKPILMPAWWQDLLLLIPRFICGYLLTSDFGAAKFGLPWSPAENNLGFFEVAFWFPNDVAAYGGIFAKFAVFFAWMGAFSEAVGGIFLLLGFLTRPFAFLIICTMLVAIFCQQFSQGTWNMLPAMGILWVGLYSLILGSGRFGIDYFISKKLNDKAFHHCSIFLSATPGLCSEDLY